MKEIKQLSISIYNRPGTLLEVTEILEGGGVNIRGMSLTEMTEEGILRMIVDDPVGGEELLKKAGISSKISTVYVIGVPDEKGGLGRLLSILGKEEINVAYIYGFLHSVQGMAYLVFKLDTKLDEAVLENTPFVLLDEEGI